MLSIRSQDRMWLIPYDKPIGIEEWNNGCDILCHNRNNGFTDITLGTYNSKERALEVLDEIEERIENENIKLIIEENGYKQIMARGASTYQMPKE